MIPIETVIQQESFESMRTEHKAPYSQRVEQTGKSIFDCLKEQQQRNYSTANMWSSKRTDIRIKNIITQNIIGPAVRRQYMLFGAPIFCVDLSVEEKHARLSRIITYDKGFNTEELLTIARQTFAKYDLVFPSADRILSWPIAELRQLSRTEPMYIV
jgi:hypothetical protein